MYAAFSIYYNSKLPGLSVVEVKTNKAVNHHLINHSLIHSFAHSLIENLRLNNFQNSVSIKKIVMYSENTQCYDAKSFTLDVAQGVEKITSKHQKVRNLK